MYLRLLACLLVAVLLVGCAAPSKKKRVAFITNNVTDFWSIARRGCEKADQELDDVDVEFKINAEGSAIGQKRFIDDLLSKKIDGIAISPVDPAAQVQLIDDAAKQTLVITQDSDAPNSNRACYIGTDNRAAGRQAGELVKEVLPNGGKIMVFVGKADAQNASDRFQGIRDALQGTKVEVLGVKSDDTDLVRAKANVADTLAKVPDIACMVGLWSYNGPAILTAVKEANKLGKVKIVCFDEDLQTLDGIKSGGIYATVVQQPYEFGYQSVQLMAKVLRGDKSAIPSSKQVFIPTLVIKREGVDAFIDKINQLRGNS
jgi:ribose transport system substrate-binding protein